MDGEKLYEAMFSLAERLTTEDPDPVAEVLAEVSPLMDRFVLGRSAATAGTTSLAMQEQAY